MFSRNQNIILIVQLAFCLLLNINKIERVSTAEIQSLRITHQNGPLRIGQTCTDFSQCPDYSACIGICDCISQHVSSQNLENCLEIRNQIWDYCEETQQCQKGSLGDLSTCLDGKCICGDDSVYPADATKCYKKAINVNDECEYDAQCTPNLEYSVCLNQKCTCFESSVASSDGAKCLREIMSLNQTCVEPIQCQIPNSDCRLPDSSTGSPQMCLCMANFFVESILTPNICLPTRNNLNEECQEDIQCGPISYDNTVKCINEKCQCPQPAQHFNGHCVIPAKLHESCDDHEQCHLGVNNLSSCIVNDENNAIKMCACITDAAELEETCIQRKIIGDNCANDLECQVSIEGPVSCSSDACGCDEGFEADESGSQCVPESER